MARTIKAQALVAKLVRPRDFILLVNPPVEETRYSWLRWNQPLDLLTIGTYLRNQVGCHVELVDYMKPDAAGRVRADLRPSDRRRSTVHDVRYPMRRYGQPYGYLKDWLEKRRSGPQPQVPTQVWITSLCSFWYESVAEVCRLVRDSLPGALVVLLGQYARLRPEHAKIACAADYVVTEPLDCADEMADLDLYGSEQPPFAALRLNPATAVAEATAAVERGVVHFTFFEEDICRDGGEPLREIVDKTKGLHKNLRFHLICGLDPAKVTPRVAAVIADRQVEEAHFEEADTGTELNVEAYRRAHAYLREAGMKEPAGRLSGFVWIGRPGDRLESLVLRTFQVLDHLGGLILKPFTPTPGSPESQAHRDYLAKIHDREWSPHFFPFAELNGITRSEYHDLYRLAAFLNERVRDEPFDFLKGTLGARMLRESLQREVWNLEPSPLRLVD